MDTIHLSPDKLAFYTSVFCCFLKVVDSNYTAWHGNKQEFLQGTQDTEYRSPLSLTIYN